jgi:hypothetical protein
MTATTIGVTLADELLDRLDDRCARADRDGAPGLAARAATG